MLCGTGPGRLSSRDEMSIEIVVYRIWSFVVFRTKAPSLPLDTAAPTKLAGSSWAASEVGQNHTLLVTHIRDKLLLYHSDPCMEFGKDVLCGKDMGDGRSRDHSR